MKYYAQFNSNEKLVGIDSTLLIADATGSTNVVNTEVPEELYIEYNEDPLKYVAGIVDDVLYPVPNPHYEEDKAALERAKLNMLYLTKREVFLALYNAKGITPEQLRSQITDERALIEFDYANDYYRGNPLIDTIGGMLGFSSSDLDYLFEHKEFPPVTE